MIVCRETKPQYNMFYKKYKSYRGLKTTTNIMPISKTVGISLIIL